MKTNIFTRVILTLYLLFIVAASGFVLACAWGIIPSAYTSYWLEQLYLNGSVVIVVSVVGVIVFLLSVFFMFSGSGRKREKTVVLKKTDSGSIEVSLNAIEEIAVRYISEIKEIRDLRTKARNADRAVDLFIKLSVTPGTVIPEVTSALQAGIKDHIELHSGILVRQVLITVDNTSQINKSRVD